MTLEEIATEAIKLCKSDKTELVNRLLESMKTADPVFAALCRFRDVYHALKGSDYARTQKFSAHDYRGMKHLIESIRSKVDYEMSDEVLLLNLESFMRATANMNNKWYFNNRFTPLNLSQEFEKIYAYLKQNDNVNRAKCAYDYL